MTRLIRSFDISTKLVGEVATILIGILFTLIPIGIQAQTTTVDFNSYTTQDQNLGNSFSSQGLSFSLIGGTTYFSVSTSLGESGTPGIDMHSSGATMFTIQKSDNSHFNLFSFYLVDGFGDANLSFKGYRDGSEVYSKSQNTYLYTGTISLNWNDVDKVEISSQDVSFLFDNIVYSDVPSATTPTVSTSATASITTTGATFSGDVTDDGGNSVTERGFVYGTNITPEIGDGRSTRLQVGGGTGSFSEAITGLTAETTYYVRAYAINGEGTSYGGEQSFTTESAGVLLSTSPTLTFTENSADITGDNIASDGEGGSQAISDIDIEIFNISDEEGSFLNSLSWKDNDFFYSADTDYIALTYDYINEGNKGMSVKSADGSEFRLIQFIYYNWAETEPFTNTIKGYRNGTEVASMIFEGFDPGYVPITVTLDASFSNVDDVRIYISDAGWNGDGTTNHSINNIQVSSPVISSSPTVTTSLVSSITTTGATFSGNATDDGGDFVTERGFVYATTSGPTTSDTKIQVGSGTGAFEEAITGLSAETTYYVRAYAINSQGTSYGSEQIFTTLSIFAGGAGTEADPYQVETAEHLDSVRDYADSHFIQTADIDLGVSPWNVGEGWEPIEGGDEGPGGGGSPFSGSYDGNGHTISGLTINRESDYGVGLFGSTSTGSTISNLGLIDVDVTGNGHVGGMVGNSNGTISNSYVTGTVHGTAREIGGLVGRGGLNDNVSSSYANVSVSGGDAVGGLVGQTQGYYDKTYSIGIVEGGTDVGGLVGNRGSGGEIKNSFWDTETSGSVNSDGGTGLSIAQMKTKSTFTDAGWDFDTVWQIEEPSSGSISYPYLQSNAQFPAPGYFEPQIPEVVTHSTIENISSGSAEVSGEVIDDKGIEVNERGFVYATSSNPTTDDTKIQVGSGMGEFTETISGLNPGITYYIRAYAINSEGTTYGTEQSFTTIPIFAGGTGTEADPYQVETAEQLNSVRNYLDVHYIQTADIDLGVSPWNDVSGWEPIGGNGNAFTGTFDGQGHTISGLTINRSTDNVGLFGYTNTGAIIRNLGLIDVSIRGRNTVGGLVGYLLDGTVSNSYVIGQVNQNTNSGNDIGGLVGSSAGTITDSYVNVIVGGSSHVGGLVGRNGGAIEGSYALGSLLGSNRLGGFVGSNDGTGTISNSYSSVDVTSNQFNQNIFGGLVGQNFGAISNSYASGIMVVNQNGAGGLVGTGSGSATESFWDTETTGQLTSFGGTGKTTAEMRTRTTFTDAGWNFDSVWQIVETSTTFSSPYLTGNEQNPAPGFLELTPPAITTQENLANLTSESVDVTGQVTHDGNVEITHRGFVWATDAAPDDTTIVWSGSSDDTFTETISDLPPATALNVRSFATNMIGTAYGNLVSFETEPGELLLTGSFTVQDKVYDGESAAMIDQNSLTLDGVYDGHDVQIGTLEIAFTDVDADVDKQVSIQSVTLSGLDVDRYTISLTNAPHSVADITERPIIVSAGAQQVTYGDEDPTLTYEITTGSLVDGDGLSGELNRTAGQNVGTYAIEQGDLTAGSNYDLSFVEADLEITPRVLAITANADQDKTYGEADPSFTYEAANFGWNDSEALITGALDREAGENVGQFAIGQGTLEAGNNYTIDFTSADFEITPKALSIVANSDQSKVYGDADPVLTFTATGFEGDDNENILNGTLNRAAGEDAGTYAIEAGNLDAGDNYTISFTAVDFEITPRPLALSNFTAEDKIYDGSSDVSGAGFEDDRIGGDELTFSFESAFVDSDADTDKPVAFSSIAISGGADANNYDLQTTAGQASANISPRPITIAADEAIVIYGDNDPTLTYKITSGSLVDGDVFTGELNRTAGLDAGMYSIEQHTLSAGSNYEITYQTADFEITLRVLTIVAEPGQGKTYGDADSKFVFTASNFGWNDEEMILTGSLDRDPGENVGTYSITPGDLDAGENYTIDFTPADFTITPKELLVVADGGQKKVYGETDPELTFAVSGFEFTDNEQVFSGALSRESGENIGEYSITTGSLSAGDNYTITLESNPFTITPKVLAVAAASGQEKVYGETDGELSFTASGFELGDQYEIFSGSLSREAGEDVGQYTIKAGHLDAGENYTIDFESDTFSILKRTLTVSADGDQHKTFGEDDPLFTFTADNFGWNDGNELITGALTREGGESTGTYELLVGSLEAGSNYEIDFESALFEIEVRSLQISAAEVSKVYGDADPELSFTATGFGFNDDESILSGELYRQAGKDAGTYAILGDQLTVSGDYTIEYSAADFTIEAKELKITADEGQSKIIGEDDPEFTFSAEGFAFDDGTDLLTGTLSRETGEETGDYLITAGTINAGENYSIVFEESVFSVLMTPPMAVQIFPADGEEKSHVDGPVTIDFDQPVLEADFDRITLKNHNGVNLPIELSIDENSLIINHETLEYVTGYRLDIEEGAVTNRDGVANRAVSSSFTTQVEVPKPVVLVGPYQHEGSVSVHPELSWNPSENATHYSVQLSGDPEFGELLSDVQNHTELSFQINRELSDYTHYYWRVQASNSSGSSEWSESGHFVTVAKTPVHGFPAMMSEEISTAPVLQWTKAYSESPVRVQLSTSENFVELLADSVSAEASAQITGLEDYHTYYWRLRIESDQTTSDWSDTMQFRTRKASSENDHEQVVENKVNFGHNPDAPAQNREITSLDYRLIGLPGNDNLRVDSFFDGRYGRDWKAFFDIGSVTEYYEEYHPDDERFVFAPGRGFWVLSKDVLDIELQTTSVKTNERDAYTIELQPGWNIISNPHRGVVSWSEVQELNNISGDLFGYEEQFIPADSLHPVLGYYYYNNVQNPLDGIDIPYSRMEQRRGENNRENNKLSGAAMSKSPEVANVTADFGADLSFGVELVYSVSDEDRGTYKRPFPSLEMSRYGMMLSDTEMYRGGYLRDETRFDAQGSRYDLELKGKVGSTFSWKAEISGLSSSAGVLLVNPVTKLTWLLESGEEAEATLTEPHTTYELYVGEMNFLLEKQEELMPVEFALEQNYPNPFNPSTNIRYSVPGQEHVRLEVYDIMGRRVMVLQDGIQQAGWHNVHFNAGSLASGVYFYRLTAGEAMKVGRMTLIK
ncbi:MBG domain-containing protein [Rhodohalobacter sp. SW132]|uniref:MBG domain-containing protein n=1 Tax=Rhodohalobacter sp. SW132 TaxID=2293433 RepID=UPI001315A7AB|nr:MBG domain-containing protein [Rhodohalobacter sp. SW132]